MPNVDIFRPIKIFGFVFIILGLYGFIAYFKTLTGVNYPLIVGLSIIIVSLFHVLMGIGIVCKKLWGFYFLKFYLYLCFLAIPIGTYIAIKSLKYIEKYNIKAFFV